MKALLDWFLAQTPAEQRDFLRKLKQYRSLVKLLGKRGKTMFARLEKNTPSVRVEVPASFSRDIFEPDVRSLLQKYFPNKSSESEIEWRENPSLTGWVRIFVDGEMWDGSWKGIQEKFDIGQ